jgi:hypothetical protein
MIRKSLFHRRLGFLKPRKQTFAAAPASPLPTATCACLHGASKLRTASCACLRRDFPRCTCTSPHGCCTYSHARLQHGHGLFHCASNAVHLCSECIRSHTCCSGSMAMRSHFDGTTQEAASAFYAGPTIMQPRCHVCKCARQEAALSCCSFPHCTMHISCVIVQDVYAELCFSSSISGGLLHATRKHLLPSLHKTMQPPTLQNQPCCGTASECHHWLLLLLQRRCSPLLCNRAIALVTAYTHKDQHTKAASLHPQVAKHREKQACH